MAWITARPYLPECAAASDPYVEPRRSAAPVERLAGTTREPLRLLPAKLATSHANGDNRRDPVPPQPACRRRGPYARFRPDWRGQVHAAGNAACAGPALSQSATA